MNRTVSITLETADLLQVVDAINERAEVWEKTTEFLLGELDTSHDFFIAEECSDSFEAAEIAQHFRNIASNIEAQLFEYSQKKEDL